MKDHTTATDHDNVPASPPHHQSSYELSTRQLGLKKRTINAPSIDEGEASPNPAKRYRHQAMTPSTSQLRSLSLLERCLMPYDVIKRIANELTSTDLFCLATVSKSAWASIKSREETWNNLNKMAKCDGRGIKCRLQNLNDVSLGDNTTDMQKWEAACEEHSATKLGTKPCSTCHRVVCDECRIHVAYRTFDKADADSPDAQHYASFFLCTINYDVDADADAQASSTGSGLHDRGLLLEDGPYRGARIEEWIDKDMGEPTLSWLEFDEGYEEFHRVCLVCQQCLEEDGAGLTGVQSCTTATEKPGTFYCKCTLRSHYLDRWLCIPCHQAELEADEAANDDTCLDLILEKECRCGAERRGDEKVICKWCSGEVLEKHLRM